MNAESKQDAIVADGKWRFDEEVTAAFDDMLKRSIPQYDVMRHTVFDIGRQFVQPKTTIVDLGCSRGESLQPFMDLFGAHNQYLGVEVSQPMIEAAKARMKGYIDCGVARIQNLDLRYEYPMTPASLTLSILTLQFTPIEYRQQIINSVYQHLLPGGCFILVEKIMAATHPINQIMNSKYLNMKAEHGYTSEQIERKRLALEGVLVPVTYKWNEELLHMAGFKHVDCFWRWCNFAGYVAIK